MQKPLIVHGLDLSYFTGKIEAYLRAKGLPYERREMDTGSFKACGRATGILQMPQIECPDGGWLTDTSLTIRYLEQQYPEPALIPADPLTRFIALLLEDMGDETLWRPALYYRWAFAADARLMSGRLAAGMLRDLPLPLGLRRLMILARQRRHFLRRDGVTAATRGAVEALYRDALAAMEQALAGQPYVLGGRPTVADFGLFGSMFRHFFSDPTPAAIMRETAPRTLAWVARLWAVTPADFAGQPLPASVPAGLQGLLALTAQSHLPYYAANAAAVAAGAGQVRFADRGASFTVPASPYRAWCLDCLRLEWQALPPDGQAAAAALLGEEATVILRADRQAPGGFSPPSLPVAGKAGARTVDRNWR